MKGRLKKGLVVKHIGTCSQRSFTCTSHEKEFNQHIWKLTKDNNVFVVQILRVSKNS